MIERTEDTADDRSELLAKIDGLSRQVERLEARSRRSEEALRFLEKVVETMQLGVTITDLDGKILYTARRARPEPGSGRTLV